jgi:hypothetical protein
MWLYLYRFAEYGQPIRSASIESPGDQPEWEFLVPFPMTVPISSVQRSQNATELNTNPAAVSPDTARMCAGSMITGLCPSALEFHAVRVHRSSQRNYKVVLGLRARRSFTRSGVAWTILQGPAAVVAGLSSLTLAIETGGHADEFSQARTGVTEPCPAHDAWRNLFVILLRALSSMRTDMLVARRALEIEMGSVGVNVSAECTDTMRGDCCRVGARCE